MLMKVVETFFFPQKTFSPLSFTYVPACRIPLVALGLHQPCWKVPEFQHVAWGRRVSGRWLMQHVKPCEAAARCPCVSLPGGQQHRCSVPYKSFHALLPSKLANSCIFHQKWVFWDFFLRSSRVGGCMDSTWKSGGWGCRKWYSLSLLATQSWIG